VIARIIAAILMIGLSGCVHPQRSRAAVEPWYPTTHENGDPLAGVFEGRVPCEEPGFVDCEKVKVALALYRNKRSGALTGYRLARVYVATSPEGSLLIVAGAAKTARGTRLDPNSTVIRLDEKAPPAFREYWQVNEDILFLLDQELGPKVGTASWSYVLNRTR
jgi:hypothetical protein